MKKILAGLIVCFAILSVGACCEHSQETMEGNNSYDWGDNVSFSNADAEEANANDIQTIYRAPYGKRYHDDPECGGKNSYEITIQQALNAGLTPCKRCIE